MVKFNRHAWILWTISLIVTMALAALIPFVHTAVYWMSLGCMAVMLGLCAFTFVRAFRRAETLESKLLGWPIFKVGYTAAIAQIAVGFALMVLSALCPVWVAIMIEVLLFGGTAFCLTVKDAAREFIMNTEATVQDNTGAWKAIRARANALAAENDSAEILKLVEAIRYADPTPSSLDEEIANQLEVLTIHADAENIQEAIKLLQRRKDLSKEEKQAK